MSARRTRLEIEHAHRLLAMLELKEPCLNCAGQFGTTTALMTVRECSLCRSFVQLPPIKHKLRQSHCPCHVLGEKEALKRTWITLEEWGYLK